MAMHRFKVNVPNPTDRAAVVQLRLEPGKLTGLAEFPRGDKRGPLKVVAAGLALDPCAESGRAELKLRIGARDSVDVYAIVTTAASSRPAATGFHVIDRRGGKDVGGVFVVCAEPTLADTVASVVPARRPCPAELVDLFAVAPGAEPLPTNAVAVAPGDAVDLVALVRAGQALKDMQIYLEHLGAGNAEFTAATWNLGHIPKGTVVPARWALQTSGWQTGVFRASLVAMAGGFDPTRLGGDYAIGPRKRVAARR
jgi:hypothetical protein